MGEEWLEAWLREQPSLRTLKGLVYLPADERPLVSLNLLVYSQMAEQSERPDCQYTWCGVLVLWEIVSKDKNYHLFSRPQSYS